MAAKSVLEQAFDGRVTVIGNKQSPRSSAFEVTMDGSLLFSKFESGCFPANQVCPRPSPPVPSPKVWAGPAACVGPTVCVCSHCQQLVDAVSEATGFAPGKVTMPARTYMGSRPHQLLLDGCGFRVPVCAKFT